MTAEIKVYGINATILDHGKVNGGQKWVIDIVHCGGTAIDRIQSAVDYRFNYEVESIENNIIANSDGYLTWSWWPFKSGTSFLITCKCAHDVDVKTARKLIDRGMNNAWREMNKIIKKEIDKK